jgi:catechol 2,3-dioxygenase-like lactoylglutathione lyase family enzyme
MLSHVHLGVTDFDRAYRYYSALMGELDYPLRFHEPEKSWAAWQPKDGLRPLFLIGHPFDGAKATPGNGQMLALLAPTREAVDNAYNKAIALGGMSEGPPGLRPQYHPNYYGAYFRDPDGNKLCVCFHEGPIAKLA